ncbi:GTP-binding protein [Streptomyces sp. NPDC005529]|uniref:GTP-binding protein n=1 Tax=unclassified Streptomyces TaxID=2593676 RepID=UPI0033AF6186
MSLEALREAVRTLPGTVYRAKGFVHTIEDPDHRMVLQVVGRRVDVSVQGTWDGQTPMTRIVAVGAPGVVDSGLLEELVTPCVAPAALLDPTG